MNTLDDFPVPPSLDNTSTITSVSVPPLVISVKESRSKSVPDIFGAWVSSDYGMGCVARLEGSGKELLAEHAKMILNGEDLGFLMEMVDGGSFGTASSDTEGTVLYPLELLNVGRCGVGEPDRGSIVQD